MDRFLQDKSGNVDSRWYQNESRVTCFFFSEHLIDERRDIPPPLECNSHGCITVTNEAYDFISFIWISDLWTHCNPLLNCKY